MRIAIAMVLVAALGAAPLFGCAHKVRTVTTTETIECDEERDPSFEEEFEGQAERQRECTEVRRETTVVTERDSGCHGAVSCSLRLVGGLVSLPFRILGEVLDTVF